MINNLSRTLFKNNYFNVIIEEKDLKKCIDEIVKNVPQNLSEIELIRYFYLSLGKILIHNTNYYYNFNYNEQQKMFEHNKQNIFPQTNEIICNSTELLTHLLKKFGIKAETFYSKKINHAETIVFTSDNKMYSFNLIEDLSKIQTNRKTRYFATTSMFHLLINELQNFYNCSCSNISDSELKAIDDKLGYTFHGLYTDDFISMLKKDIIENSSSIVPSDIHFENEYDKNENMRKYIVEFLLNRCNILNEQLAPVGFEEIVRYYWNMFAQVLPKEDFEKINLYRCYFDGKISNAEMISLISLAYKDNFLYYSYNRNLRKIY